MLKELLKKESKSKYDRGMYVKAYKVEKLEKPVKVVTPFPVLKKVQPTALSNAIGETKQGCIFESSEIYYEVNKSKDVVSEGYYKNNEGRFILKSATREVIPSKDFGIARDNIVLKRFFNQTASELAKIDEGELFVIRYKFKLGNKIVYNIVYKGKTGYIVEPDIEETDNLAVEDCARLIKDLAMNI